MSLISESQIADLKKSATEALSHPYPLSAEQVYAAAVMSKEGHIFSAAQYFSDTYTLTLHAEQCALVHAATHGEGDIQAIVITSNIPGDELQYCCHMCKQLLWENHLRSKIDFPIIFFNAAGKEETILISQLITHPWPRPAK